MSVKVFDVCCRCKGAGSIESSDMKNRSQTLSSADERGICTAAFLPECVRNTVRDMKDKNRTTTPFSMELSVISLVCEISAVHESIDMYSISSNYSVVDVLDELNRHVAGIVKRIVVERGDIIHLEGGFIECVWPIDNEDAHLTHRIVLNTALAIQKEFGEIKTRIGCQLHNKMGIAVGKINVCMVGSENFYYVIIGDVLNDARNTLFRCNKNEVIVSPMFWENVNNKSQYEFKESLDDYVTVYSTAVTLKATEAFDADTYAQLKPCSTDIDREMNAFLHPFYKSVRTKQQLQVLTFLSQIVFMAVRLSSSDVDITSLNVLQKGTNLVYDIVKKHEGVITKIIYRKDPTICVVFGFPGFKHKDDAVRSIWCAKSIMESIAVLEINASIGISSGTVFCGVLGTIPRQELCILGMPSHISLSLVDQLQNGKTVCDTNTFFRSLRVLGEIFTPLRKRLKGFKLSRLFFEIHYSEQQKRSPAAKCVDRKDEKEKIRNALKELKESMEDLEDSLPLITITGKVGTGKSTLLSWTIQEGKRLGYRLRARVANCAFETPSDNAWSILKQILTHCLMDTDSKILDLLGSNAQMYPLHLLNNKMNTTFKKPYMFLESQNVRDMMVELIKKCARNERILLAVDNAEHTGPQSWLFLQSLLDKHLAVVVATFTEDFGVSALFVRHLIDQQYLGAYLGPIKGDDLVNLACHILHVDALHKTFLDFLQVESGGNALHLQEILMLPPLQKHFCIIPHTSVNEKNLAENFVYADEEDGKSVDRSTAKVCDIVDLNGLQSIIIPKEILHLVEDHATGLNPEEQMFLRKCSLFGDTFGLHILESVCPEYSVDELNQTLQGLVEKNILTPTCEHWIVDVLSNRMKICMGEVSLEYCIHPLRFASCYLKRSLFDSMAENRRERLNLYLADLLREETNQNCDACRKERGVKKPVLNSQDLVRQYKIPNVDFRLCQCLNLKTDFMIQLEYHLQKGKAPACKRIDVLIDAAEKGLDARAISKVEEILNKIKRLRNNEEDKREPDYVKVAIERLRARIKFLTGNKDDAFRCLKHAVEFMGIAFPHDIKRGSYTSKKFKDRLGIEECRCLSLGCYILTALGLYEDAIRAGKQLVGFLFQEEQEFRELLEARVLYLNAVLKSEPGRSRERKSFELINQIRQQCFKRLTEYPILEIEELRVIIQAFKNLVQLLFETNQQEASKDLGRKSFQLLKILNHPAQLVRILFWLVNIYFLEENYRKCLEVMSELQDAYQQCGDSVSEAIYHIALARIVKEPKISLENRDQIVICNDYAARGSYTTSFHPKHSSKIFCLNSVMAVWCLEQNLDSRFSKWYDQAINLQKTMHLNNFWSIFGSIYLEIAKILKMQEKYFMLTVNEVSSFKQSSNKSIENIQKHVKTFVPVLERDVLDIEKYLEKALKECKVLKD